MRWPLAMLLVAALVACGSGTSEPDRVQQTVASFNPLSDPTEVPVLIREHLGGESPTIKRISLSEGSLYVTVRDPNKPENLDDYRFDGGTWNTSPVSVSQRDIDELDQTTFRLNQIAWDKIPHLQEQALAGLDLEGEEVTSVSIDRLLDQQPRIYVSVQGLRGSGYLLATGDGGEVRIQRS